MSRINNYLLSEIIKNISKESLACRLLSKDFKEEVDTRKFVFKSLNDHQFLENDKRFGIFEIVSAEKLLQTMFVDISPDRDRDLVDMRFWLGQNNMISKPETKIFLKYDMFISSNLKPGDITLSNNHDLITTRANRRLLNTEFIRSRFENKGFDDDTKLNKYSVVETIKILDNKAKNNDKRRFRQYFIDIQTKPNPNVIIYKNMFVITDQELCLG